MQPDAHPYRSVLYMPGSRPRALEKARSLPADALILDLEDAVAPAEKPGARELVAEAVEAGGYGGRPLLDPHQRPRHRVGRGRPGAAPRSPGRTRCCCPRSRAPERRHRRRRAPRAPRRARAHPPLGDDGDAARHPERRRDRRGAPAARRLRPRHQRPRQGPRRRAHPRPPAAASTSLGLCLLAARAEGLVCVDGVYNAFQDAEGLRAVCIQGRDMGFDGKTLIHPDQLAVANAGLRALARGHRARRGPGRRLRGGPGARRRRRRRQRPHRREPARRHGAPPARPRRRDRRAGGGVVSLLILGLDRLDRRPPLQARSRPRRPRPPRRQARRSARRAAAIALAILAGAGADRHRLPPRAVRAGLRPALLGHPPQQPR